MLDNLDSKVKKLIVKYLNAYKIRVTNYIHIEKGGSSSDCDEVMFSADNHGNVNVNNILNTKSLVTNTIGTISEQFYAPSSFIANSGTNTVVLNLNTNDLLKNKHIIINGKENNADINLTIPTAANLLSAATSLLGRKPNVSTLSSKGDWFIFTVTNNSPSSYCALAPVTLVVSPNNSISPNGTVIITGSENGLGSLCTGASHFGLYFTNVNSDSVAAVTILRLSGSIATV